MDTTQIPHTFVRTVKAQDLCFNQVDDVLENVKAKSSPTWVILAFAVRTFLRFGFLSLSLSCECGCCRGYESLYAPHVPDVPFR